MKLNKKWIIAAVIVCAFIGNFIRYSNRAPKRHYCDFRVYYATGERLLYKQDIYSRPDQKITPYKYSPAFAFFMTPLSLTSQHTASLIFFTLNFLSVIAICYFSRKLIFDGKLTGKQNFLLFFFPILFTFRFILQVWDTGQVNLMMLLLVIIGLYALKKKRLFLSAASIGFSIMIKYVPAIFLPYLFIRKQYKLIALILAFILLFCCLPAVYVGVGQQAQYLKNWMPFITKTSLDKGSYTDYKNQSIYSMFLRYLTKEHPYKISFANFKFQQAYIMAMLFAFVLYVLILIPKGNVQSLLLEDYGLLLLCMAIFNPNAWMLNFVVFLFTYIFLMYYLIKVSFKDKLTLVLMIMAFALTSWASESIVGNNLENLFEELSSVTIGALMLIFVLLRIKYQQLFVQIKEK